MLIQKLPWAGIRIRSGETKIAIDPLFNFPAMFGEPQEPLVPLRQFGDVDAVLITHHHSDHFDPDAIEQFYGADIPVYMSSETLRQIGNAHQLTNIRTVTLHETVEIGEVTATASYSVDGFGEPQVSWIVAGDGKKMIHCGDTLWHGYWWRMNREHGPFDAACLPVNGPVLELSFLKPSGQAAALNPEQAVAAARLLEAKVLIPIHYRTINNPPVYAETPNIEQRLQTAVHDDIQLALLKTNESILLQQDER